MQEVSVENAKVSDSGYSNSCSNSQSQRRWVRFLRCRKFSSRNSKLSRTRVGYDDAALILTFLHRVQRWLKRYISQQLNWEYQIFFQWSIFIEKNCILKWCNMSNVFLFFFQILHFMNFTSKIRAFFQKIISTTKIGGVKSTVPFVSSIKCCDPFSSRNW